MAKIYDEEQLNKFDKETIIQLFLMQQEQLAEIDRKLQLVLEQLSVSKRNRYGRATEKMESSQLSFQEVDGEIVIIFNEAEALADENADELTEEVIKKKSNKRKGKQRISAIFQRRSSIMISVKTSSKSCIRTRTGNACRMKCITDTVSLPQR